jgi:hypothetical protein
VTKLDELASASVAAGVRLQSLEDALATSAVVDDPAALRAAIRLGPEFGDYLLRCFEAVEWCEQKERGSILSPEAIIAEAVERFFDPINKKTREQFAESLHSAWRRKDWRAFNRLKRHKKVTGLADPVTATKFASNVQPKSTKP